MLFSTSYLLFFYTTTGSPFYDLKQTMDKYPNEDIYQHDKCQILKEHA